jgi:hypothetical protein
MRQLDQDSAPVHGIPRPSLIECNGVRRDNPSALFCLWDFTLDALIYRLVTERGSDLANYELTFTKKNTQGDWVAL